MPLGKRAEFGDARYAGVDISYAHNIADRMQEYLLCGFDFVVAPLVDPKHQQPALPGNAAAADAPAVIRARQRTELMLSSASWGGQIVGRTSSWIDPDAADASLASTSCAALQQELSWAAFLGLQAVLLPAPKQLDRAFNYTQVVNQALGGLSNMAVWVQMPMTAAAAATGGAAAGSNASSGSNDAPFDCWTRMLQMCENNNLLGVAVEVPADLPPKPVIARWWAQPLKALLLPTSVFTTNKRGYPVLSRPHQDLLATAYKFGVQVILTGEALHKVAPTPTPAAAPTTPAADVPQQQPGAAADGSSQLQQLPGGAAAGAAAAQGAAPGAAAGAAVAGADGVLPFAVVDPGESHVLRPYWEYLCYLFRRLDSVSPQEQLEAGYRDFLQAPLQPLQDNLESQTYEVFEKDVTKYACYQAAVAAALLDRVPDSQVQEVTTVLMVVGAGRGPLVRASLAAAAATGRRLRVYAVEKNPAAVVHIQSMVVSQGWEEVVTIVGQDMRLWQPPEQADILVSELLGSFGDNELSPECLDGAQRLLKPDGISIPASYTSFLAPITSCKMLDAVRTYKDLEHAETPYVVKLHRYFALSPPQPVFTFTHPNWQQPADNSRAISLTFQRPAEQGSGVLHGFAGYFESVLYKDVTLNTHPPTHTPNMFSWFPIYFPLKEPMVLPAGAPVVAHMWRKCGAHKVWYEWAVSEPTATHIHNAGGRSYYVGL